MSFDPKELIHKLAENHEPVWMSDNEAAPAAYGLKCVRCDAYRLQWLGWGEWSKKACAPEGGTA